MAVPLQRAPGPRPGRHREPPAYGIAAHRPFPPQRQSWNGQAMASPLTVPWLRSPPMCRQYESSTCRAPEESATPRAWCRTRRPRAGRRHGTWPRAPGSASHARTWPAARPLRYSEPDPYLKTRTCSSLGIWQCPIMQGPISRQKRYAGGYRRGHRTAPHPEAARPGNRGRPDRPGRVGQVAGRDGLLPAAPAQERGRPGGGPGHVLHRGPADRQRVRVDRLGRLGGRRALLAARPVP